MKKTYKIWQLCVETETEVLVKFSDETALAKDSYTEHAPHPTV